MNVISHIAKRTARVTPRLMCSVAVAVIWSASSTAQAQVEDSLAEILIREKILNRRVFTPQEVLEIDQNNDGVIDVRDLVLFYQNNPNAKAFVAFETSASKAVADGSTVHIRVLFSRPYHGPVKYRFGGTALDGVDFDLLPGQIAAPGIGAIQGEVMSTGMQVEIPVKTRELAEFSSSRTLVITLMADDPEMADPPPQPANYLLSRTSPDPAKANPSLHRLVLCSGDRGVYGGVLVFSSEPLEEGGVRRNPPLDAQALTIALRGNHQAHVDVSKSSFFREKFSFPVAFNHNGTFAFPSSIQGSFNVRVSPPGAPIEERTASWTLVLSPLVFSQSNNVAEASATLSFSGLTSSSAITTAGNGTLYLQRLPD